MQEMDKCETYYFTILKPLAYFDAQPPVLTIKLSCKRSRNPQTADLSKRETESFAVVLHW